MTSLRKFTNEQDGIASIEFAIILPMILAMLVGVFNLTDRLHTVNTVERYAHQLGDVLSRYDELSTGDISIFYNEAAKMLDGVDEVAVEVVSIGFQENGDAVMLWSKTIGSISGKAPDAGLASLELEADTLLRVRTRAVTNPLFTGFPAGETTAIERSRIFKPRTTRAISLDGQIVADGINWDFSYE